MELPGQLPDSLQEASRRQRKQTRATRVEAGRGGGEGDGDTWERLSPGSTSTAGPSRLCESVRSFPLKLAGVGFLGPG